MPLFTEVKVNQVQERPPNYHYALGCVSADGTLYEEEGCTIAFVGTVLCTITCYRVMHSHSTPSLLRFYPSDSVHSASTLQTQPPLILPLRLRPPLLLLLRLGPPPFHSHPPRNDSERNSSSFLFCEIGGIPKEQWSGPSCFVFREIIFLLEIGNPMSNIILVDYNS